MSRSLRLSQTFALLMVLLSAHTLSADILTVTSTADAGAGSLRSTIDSAAAGDTIILDGSLSGAIFTLTTGELVLDKDLLIVGLGGSNTAINANGVSRIFRVDSGVTAEVRGYTLALGFAGGTGEGANGGGIYNAGNLELNDVKLLGCTADSLGGAIYSSGNLSASTTVIKNGFAQKGGGVYAAGGFLGLFDFKVEDNTAPQGGGLWLEGSTATLTEGLIGRNEALLDGGGLYAAAGSCTASRISFSNNSAGGNGGAAYALVDLVVSRSTFAENDAIGDGGGVYTASGAGLSVENSTWSGNSAGGNGGAAHISSEILCRSNTVTDNTAALDGGGFFLVSTFVLRVIDNSILSGNRVDTLADDIANASTIFTSAYNLYGVIDDGSFSAGTGDLIGAPAMLGPLANNGGETRTHALLCGSAAINAANPGLASTLDQRRLPRMVDGRSDIGALEKQDTCAVAPACAIDSVVLGTQSACDPLTDTYSQELIVYSTDAPATDSLSVNGLLFAADADTVLLTGLSSDGLPVDLTVLYTADSACAFALDSAWTAPESCLLPPCAIDSVLLGTQSACDPLTDTYSQELIVYSTSAPATDSLSVNGVLFAADADTVLLTGLSSDGLPVDLTVLYTADSACAFALDSAWTAPAPCFDCTAQTPTNLQSSYNAVTGNMDLSWDPIPTTVGIQVSGRPLGAPGFANVRRLGFEVSNLSVPEGQLTAGQTYEWFVTGACIIPPTASDLTNPSSIETFTYPDTSSGSGCNSDSVPILLGAAFQPVDSSIVLSWDPPNGMINCRLNIRPLGAATFALRILDGDPPTSDTLPASGFVPGQSYEWRVKCSCSVPPLPGEETDFSPLDTFTYLLPRMAASGLPLDVQVMPNPATTQVLLQAADFPAGAYQLDLVDMAGRVQRSWTGESATPGLRRVLAVGGLPASAYLLRVTHATGVSGIRIQLLD